MSDRSDESQMERAWPAGVFMDVTADEIEVAQILLELPCLIQKSEFGPRFSFSWGVKKPRSSIAEDDTASKPGVGLPPTAASPLPSLNVNPLQTAAMAPTANETYGAPKKPLASSPDTPLLFSPSESDDKLKPSKPSKRKVSVQRKREELLEMTFDLTKSNETLRMELENMKLHYEDLKAYSSMLKAKRSEVVGDVEEEVQGEAGTSCKSHNVEVQKGQQQVPGEGSGFPSSQTVPLVASNPAAAEVDDKVGPFNIPDLNISAEEAFELDKASMAAQARLRRIQICQSKKARLLEF